MSDHADKDNRDDNDNPALAAAAFVQTCENIRHIRNERIWFGNAYTAVIAGGLALLQRDAGASGSAKPQMTVGFVVLLLFSLVSLMSSIRLVTELRTCIANLQHIVTENGMSRMVGMIEPPRSFASSLPIRWVFPIFFGLTTAAILMLLFIHVLQ